MIAMMRLHPVRGMTWDEMIFGAGVMTMTATRLTLATVLLCGGLLATRAPAQESDSARLQAIVACGTIDKKSARLACYDALVRAVPAGVASAPVAAPAPSFGSKAIKQSITERAKVAPVKEASQTIGRTTSAIDDGVGHYTITMEDGARWQMTELSPGFVPPRAGDTVRIRKASLGSYLMEVNYQAAVRVTRVR